MSEYLEQVKLFAWARAHRTLEVYPDLCLLEGSMNGVPLSKLLAAKAKAAGMLKGAHDIRLPVRRGSFVGLSIELKVGNNKPTPEQLWYGEQLEKQGWRVCYCWGFEQTQKQLIDYLEMRANG